MGDWTMVSQKDFDDIKQRLSKLEKLMMPKHKRQIGEKEIKKMQKLKSDGYSCRAIDAMMGCSFSTVSRLTN